MLNNITIMGRLTRDPDLRRTGSGIAVCSFTIACDRDFADKNTKERETDFVDCVAWRGCGEMVAKYFTKGRMAVVQGRLEGRKWKDKQGNNRYTLEIKAENVYFGDSKKEGSAQQAADPQVGAYATPGYATPGYAATGFAPAPSAPAAPTGFPGYAGTPSSDFAMLEDSDAQLPF